MPLHDPYTLMLEALYELMDFNTEGLVREGLRHSQDYVRELRSAYKSSPCKVNYSSAQLRAAYLFAYYPHYVEVLYHVLREIPEKYLDHLYKPTLRACFLGAGPAPEILGLLAYLNENITGVKKVKACLFDKYVNDWRIGQDITCYRLAPQYCSSAKVAMTPVLFDLLGTDEWSDLAKHSFRRSDICVMQNAINDQLDNAPNLLASLLSIFETTVSGTIFVIIDLHYTKIRNFMHNFQKNIEEMELGQVILGVNEGRKIESQIDVPEILLEELLTHGDGLIPRRYTEFYSSVLIRT